MPTRPYLVVALRVKAVIVLTVLVGAMDVATVLTAREPEGRGAGLRPLRAAALGRTLPSLPREDSAVKAAEQICAHTLGKCRWGLGGPVPCVGAQGGRGGLWG